MTPGTGAALASMRTWPVRRWTVAAASAAAFVLLVAVPTDLIDTPFFSREIPPTWWSWPALLISAVLSGLVAATFVRAHPDMEEASERAVTRRGWIGGALTFFAVGCPVCNKVVLLLLGTSGALTWFEPVQPLLQVGAVVLLAWALMTRLRGELACPVTPAPAPTEGVPHG